MSVVQLSPSAVSRSCEVFMLYAKKGAFQVEEFTDAGAVYTRLTSALKDSEGKSSVDVTEIDVKYVVNVIDVCSQRTPVEARNFKPIADLLTSLTAVVTPPTEETPSVDEEQKEESSSITEL